MTRLSPRNCEQTFVPGVPWSLLRCVGFLGAVAAPASWRGSNAAWRWSFRFLDATEPQMLKPACENPFCNLSTFRFGGRGCGLTKSKMLRRIM